MIVKSIFRFLPYAKFHKQIFSIFVRDVDSNTFDGAGLLLFKFNGAQSTNIVFLGD